MFITRTENRFLAVGFDEGNFLLDETVKEKGEKSRTDTIWLTAEEIERLHEFKKKMTGESR